MFPSVAAAVAACLAVARFPHRTVNDREFAATRSRRANDFADMDGFTLNALDDGGVEKSRHFGKYGEHSYTRCSLSQRNAGEGAYSQALAGGGRNPRVKGHVVAEKCPVLAHALAGKSGVQVKPGSRRRSACSATGDTADLVCARRDRGNGNAGSAEFGFQSRGELHQPPKGEILDGGSLTFSA